MLTSTDENRQDAFRYTIRLKRQQNTGEYVTTTICWRCGSAMTGLSFRCPGCGARPSALVSPTHGVIVKTYHSSSQAEANRVFQRDAQELARSNYYPTSQSWAPGSWGLGAFILALLLCILVIGIIVIIYMLIVKPKGSLSVTYQFRPPPP
jgi:hypothetical protein